MERQQVLDEVMERDPAFELAALVNAAEGVGLPHLADSLRAFADRRAEPGPVRLVDADGNERKLIGEWLEEVADGVGNYGPWELQRRMLANEDDDGRVAYLQEALKYGVLMYGALKKAAEE